MIKPTNNLRTIGKSRPIITGKLLSLQNLSIFLLTLPYLTFNYENIFHSYFYSFEKFMLITVSILFIDLTVKWILSRFKDQRNAIISLIIVFICFEFLYGIYVIHFIKPLLKDSLNILVRGRTLIEIMIVIFLIILFYLRKKNIRYMYFNVFLIIFTVVTFFSSFQSVREKNKYSFRNNYFGVDRNDISIKPIVLLFSDAYTSPDDLFNIDKDSVVYQFSQKLNQQNWLVKNNFYSYEIGTTLSLSSLFNFNLSRDKSYGNESLDNPNLIRASLIDSLERKEVDFINLGLFQIGESPSVSFLKLTATSFFETVMMNTIYYTLKLNTNNFKMNGLNNSFYPMTNHNKYIFKTLNDTLNQVTDSKTFIYTHLLMPHIPFEFGDEFPLKKENNLTNYKAFWNFTNSKLLVLLNQLIEDNKFRIILTGDHGFNGDERINPHHTFTAFYGFDSVSINSLNSVQDIGSLINSYY